jgi:hypothetical protein
VRETTAGAEPEHPGAARLAECHQVDVVVDRDRDPELLQQHRRNPIARVHSVTVHRRSVPLVRPFVTAVRVAHEVGAVLVEVRDGDGRSDRGRSPRAGTDRRRAGGITYEEESITLPEVPGTGIRGLGR